jgi:hypothetical protein
MRAAVIALMSAPTVLDAEGQPSADQINEAFGEPQWTVAHEGAGQPQFQLYAGVNLQFPKHK